VLVAPLPAAEWDALFLAVMGAIVAPGILTEVRAHAAAAAAELGRDAARDPADSAVDGPAGGPAADSAPSGPVLAAPIDWPTLELTDEERRVVDHAVEVLLARGDEAVVVRDVCEATGVSRGWFARHFGGRDELVDLARLDRLLAFTRAETSAYEQALGSATDPANLEGCLAAVVERSREPAFLVAAWDRLDLVVAVAEPGRDRLAEDARRIVAAGLARIATAFSDAQARGVVRPDVPPRAVARFVWGYPLAFLLGNVAGVSGDDLQTLARRTNATLAVPLGVSSAASARRCG